MSDEERRSPALDRLFSVLPDPILLIDETGRLLQANRAASRLLARDATATTARMREHFTNGLTAAV